MLFDFAQMLFNKILFEANDFAPLSTICSIATGKEDANFATANGKYPFFTCSQEILKCDIPAFEGKTILIAGNGDFNVKHYNGKFNAYQRTYVIKPKLEIDYASVYFSSILTIQKFIKRSVGSIVKFITLSDIENIEIPICVDMEKLELLNNCILLLDQIDKEIQKAAMHKQYLLPLLMNGQAVVH